MGYKTYTCPISQDCGGGCEWLAVSLPHTAASQAGAGPRPARDMASADGASLEDIRGMDEPVRYRHKAATPFAPTHMAAACAAASTPREPIASCPATNASLRTRAPEPS